MGKHVIKEVKGYHKCKGKNCNTMLKDKKYDEYCSSYCEKTREK